MLQHPGARTVSCHMRENRWPEKKKQPKEWRLVRKRAVWREERGREGGREGVGDGSDTRIPGSHWYTREARTRTRSVCTWGRKEKGVQRREGIWEHMHGRKIRQKCLKAHSGKRCPVNEGSVMIYLKSLPMSMPCLRDLRQNFAKSCMDSCCLWDAEYLIGAGRESMAQTDDPTVCRRCGGHGAQQTDFLISTFAYLTWFFSGKLYKWQGLGVLT